MLGIIALSGQCVYSSSLLKLVKNANCYIAADGGIRHLAALGITPDYLLGDMDSIASDLFSSAKNDNSINIIEYSKRKNMTDSEIALTKALSLGCTGLVIIGSLGSRPDHVLANQMMAAKLANDGISSILTDGSTYIYTLSKYNTPINLKALKAEYYDCMISIIPVIGTLKNLTIEGLEYPLTNHDVFFGSTETVSNTIKENASDKADEAVISLTDGIAFVVVTPKDA